MPAGYSGTPLVKKLGYKTGFRVFVDDEPATYRQSLEPLPEDVVFCEQLENDLDLIHVFTDSAKELAVKLKRFVKKIKADGAIWVSWPKKASKTPTDVTEDVIRNLAWRRCWWMSRCARWTKCGRG